MFKQSIAALICAVLLLISSTSLYAESKVHVEASDDLVENFALLASFSVLFVVSIPIYYLVYRPIETLSDKYHDNRSARLKAKNNVPDMEVKEVGKDENGNPKVNLQDPNNAENFAVLIWPEQKDNPSIGFQQGKLINFQPSNQGSGWLLRDDRGTALAFLPADAVREDNYSSAF